MYLHILFFFFRRVYTSRTFIIPVVVFTLFYNIPKFFELQVKVPYTGEKVKKGASYTCRVHKNKPTTFPIDFFTILETQDQEISELYNVA